MARKTKIRPLSASLLAAILAAVPLGGCNRTTATALGSVAGAAGGYFLGKEIGGTAGSVVGGLAGAAVGGLIGNQIGAYLDEDEQKQASHAAQKALDSSAVGPGSSQTWKSPTNPGTSGGTTVTQQTSAPDGRVCKKATSYVKVKGKDVSETETYCRDPQTGGWILQA
jgi:surface antigen